MKKILLCALISLLIANTDVANASNGDEVVANPDRPSVSSNPGVIHPGYMELEFGVARADANSFLSLPMTLKIGINDRFDIRITSNSLWSTQEVQGDGFSGTGDIVLSAKLRLINESANKPAFTILPLVKLPTGNEKEGFSSGEADFGVIAILGKNLHKYHIDFNAGISFLGVPENSESNSSFDSQGLLAFAVSRSLTEKVGVYAEIAGILTDNSIDDEIASTDFGLSYSPYPTLVFDIGLDVGLSDAASDYTFFTGLTLTLFKIFDR